MPDLQALSQYMKSNNYLTPRMGVGAGAPAPSDALTDGTATNIARRESMTQTLFSAKYGEGDDSTITRAGKLLASAGIDMIDMVGGSLVPGVDRGDVWNSMREHGLNGLADYAARNQSGVELTSGLVGGLLTGYAAEAYLFPMLTSRLAASTMLSGTKLYQMGGAMIGGAKQAAMDSAVSAAISGEAATVFSSVGGRQLLKARVAESVGKAVTAEAAVAAVTHSNREVWSDDASTNLMFASLGVGIGGALGALGARFEMRQIANSDEIMNLRAAASDPYGNTVIREIQPSEKELKTLGPGAQFKESVNFTGLMLQARQTIPEDLPGNRARLLRAESIQANQQAHESLQKITSRGIEGAPGTNFSVTRELEKPAVKHITDAAHNDPTILAGIDSLGIGNFGRNIDNRATYIESLRSVEDGVIPDAAQLKHARELEEQEALGLVNQNWMPDDAGGNMRAIGNYEPGKVTLTPTTNAKGNYEFVVDLSHGKKVTIQEGGLLAGPSAPRFSTFRIDDQLKVYEGLNKQMARMLGQKQTLTLGAKPTWLQIDTALAYKAKGGSIDFLTHGAAKDEQDLMMQSLRLKAEEASALSKKGVNFDFWQRAKLNLPLPSSLERIHDGTSTIMTDLLNAVRKNPNMTYKEAVEFRTKGLQMSNLRDGQKTKDAALAGDMFNFNRDSNGQWRPIVTGFSSFNRISPELRGTREWLMVATAENKVARFQALQKGGFTKEFANSLARLPEFEVSMNIRGLADDQVTGLASETSQTLGSILTKDMRYRDSKTMQAISRVREFANRMKENYTYNFMTSTFNGIQNQLASMPNKGSKALVDQFFSFAGGWDLKKSPVAVGAEHVGFELADTARNRARLGRNIEEGELLRSPVTGKEVVLDGLGAEFMRKFQSGAKQLLKETNAVRASRGLTPLESKAWYVPPPNTKGKIVGFTIAKDGTVMPGGGIVASSQEEFDRLARAREATFENGERLFSKAELESTADLWDAAEMGWVDSAFIGGVRKEQTGSIFGSVMNPNATEDSLSWMTDRISGITDGMMRSLYDQQLAIVRARSAAEETLEGGSHLASRNIWDEYEANVRGVPLSGIKPDRLTKFVQEAEKPIQAFIDMGWPLVKAIGATRVSQWASDMAQRLGMKPLKGIKSFEDLAAKLGPHTPYANAQQYMEATQGVRVSPELRQITNSVNSLSASLLLRWFEFPNAAMNMLGVITNMPSIVRSRNTPLLGELVGANGKKIGVVDSYKIMAGGFADMLAGAKHADWDTMVRNGDTTQSVAELHKQLSLIESKSTFHRVMGGDKTVKWKGGTPKTKTELAAFLQHKGVDGMISLATDTTESMSRAWSHFIGLRLADAQGIVGQEARHSFARQVANQAIANYNPLNKPELFQSSVGSMFGLFTSYMQQYNQRLFRWLETKDYTSVMRQLAMQSTLFGVASVPGYNGLEWLTQGAGSNPDATLTDMIYAKYGPKVGNVIAHGGIQEIPKVFGLDNGLALYSRADANFRAPTLDPTRLMAGLNVVSSVIEGMWEVGAKVADSDSDLTGRYVAEVLGRIAPNRAMKGTLQMLFTDGMELDASGQIVSDSQGMFESSLRMMGMRSTRQQGEIEAYYANASQRRRMANRMETLREETRSMIRAGKPIDTMALFNKYVDKGGSPSHFRQWLQDQLKTQQDTRGMNDFVKSLRSDSTQLEAWRYDIRQ